MLLFDYKRQFLGCLILTKHKEPYQGLYETDLAYALIARW